MNTLFKLMLPNGVTGWRARIAIAGGLVFAAGMIGTVILVVFWGYTGNWLFGLVIPAIIGAKALHWGRGDRFG